MRMARTSYSTAGSNVFISPAGEYGEIEPAMITTDQSTCLQGYSSFPYGDRLTLSRCVYQHPVF